VTFTGTDVNDVAASGVKIYDDSTGGTPNEWDAGDTLKGTASFSGTTADVTVSISVDSTPTQYLVTYDIAAGATLTNTLQGAITAATVSNVLVNNDTTDATLTVSAFLTCSKSTTAGAMMMEQKVRLLGLPRKTRLFPVWQTVHPCVFGLRFQMRGRRMTPDQQLTCLNMQPPQAAPGQRLRMRAAPPTPTGKW
jgi:hypothetical protein